MMDLLLAALLAAAQPAGSLSVDPAASDVRFHVVHKLHGVEGVSRQIEGRAVVQADGTVLAMVRVPVQSFHSGVDNRDAHMLEVLEVGKYPFVVFKGRVQLGPGRELPTAPVAMEGVVDLHGVQRPTTVPLTIEAKGDGSLRVRGGFDVSLEAHHVERPALLFVKIQDGCHIQVDLQLRPEK